MDAFFFLKVASHSFLNVMLISHLFKVESLNRFKCMRLPSFSSSLAWLYWRLTGSWRTCPASSRCIVTDQPIKYCSLRLQRVVIVRLYVVRVGVSGLLRNGQWIKMTTITLDGCLWTRGIGQVALVLEISSFCHSFHNVSRIILLQCKGFVPRRSLWIFD